MIVGVLQFELLIHDASCLKDKRRVVCALRDRLHREHLVAFAETGALNKHNLALCAVSAVGADAARVGSVLDRISTKLRKLTDAELGGTARELITLPAMGTTTLGDDDLAAITDEVLDRAESLGPISEREAS